MISIRTKNTGMFPKGTLQPMTNKTNKQVEYVSPTADTAIGRYMSTFYPKRFTYKGISYPTIEHAYQATKFRYFSDNPVLYMKFRCGGSVKTGKEAQRLGSTSGLREIGVHIDTNEWELHKYETFRSIVFAREKQDKLFHQIITASMGNRGPRLDARGRMNTWITSGATGNGGEEYEDW